MIKKMKKFLFLVTSEEYDGFINSIRELGVVHVDELQKGATSDELQLALARADRYRKALADLDFAAKTYKTGNPGVTPDVDTSSALELVSYVEKQGEDELVCRHRLDEVEKDIALLAPWGEFDWNNIRGLERQGYVATFYVCSSKSFKKEWESDCFATRVNDVDGKTYFITFTKETPDITAEALALPEKRLSEYKEEKRQLEKELSVIHDRLLVIESKYKDVIVAGQTANENDVSLSKVHLSHETIADGAVRLLVGWVLDEKKDAVVDYLEKAHIFYEMSDPGFDDDVPVKIHDNKFASLFEPILRMYSLPNYHDIDPLPMFAPFFMLFFGMCMGDTGYGLIIMAISLLVCVLKPGLKKFGLLGALLGGMTVVCGSVTGSFFGIDLSSVDWEWIKPVQSYFVNDSLKDKFLGYSPMMVISVIVGLVQVLLGMVMAGCKAVKNYGPVYGVGKFSWVVALLSATLLYGFPVFGFEWPVAVQYVFYVLIALSCVGIFFLNSPGVYDKPVLGTVKNLGSGVWAVYGMATGLLGDLLSYIRLFALGLTGGILGSVFNSLAIDLTSSMPWAIRWLPMVIILLLGHGINFALCMISSFVHPMRLTFVEYFKNAEFEGGGTEYNPFKIKK